MYVLTVNQGVQLGSGVLSPQNEGQCRSAMGISAWNAST